jgi:hypothetical protein
MGEVGRSDVGAKVACVLVPCTALDRLLTAAESIGGQYEGVHPALRECHEAAVALREALR